MRLFARIAAFIGCASIALVAGSVVRPVIVAKDGTGDFQTVQAAVDAAGLSGSVIRIRPGIYIEKIVIDEAKIRLEGLGHRPSDVVLSFNQSAAMAGGTFKSASTTVIGDDFYAGNLTFENTFSRGRPLGAEGSQAVAFRITGDRAIFRRVRFLGYQDTLYASTLGCMTEATTCKPARQYYDHCYIEGNVDYIFGDAIAFFDHCQIHSLAHDPVAITAQSKHLPNQKSGYVFDHCRLTAEPGADKVYLGRPWRAYASVVFLDTYMPAAIVPAAWLEWEHDGVLSLATSYYAEYGSRGPGARVDARDSHAVRLTTEQARKYRVVPYLAGDDAWDPRRVR